MPLASVGALGIVRRLAFFGATRAIWSDHLFRSSLFLRRDVPSSPWSCLDPGMRLTSPRLANERKAHRSQRIIGSVVSLVLEFGCNDWFPRGFRAIRGLSSLTAGWHALSPRRAWASAPGETYAEAGPRPSRTQGVPPRRSTSPRKHRPEGLRAPSGGHHPQRQPIGVPGDLHGPGVGWWHITPDPGSSPKFGSYSASPACRWNRGCNSACRPNRLRLDRNRCPKSRS